MRLLLDTHALLWWVEDAPLLSGVARRQIADEQNDCFVSLATAWEMAINASLNNSSLLCQFNALGRGRRSPGSRSPGCAVTPQ